MELALTNIKVQGMTIIELVMSKIPSDYQDLAGDIEPLVFCLVQVILFIIAFLVVKLVSNVLSGLVNVIFFREKKAKLLGGIVGLVQGALVAVCICVPLTGLVSTLSQIQDLELNGNKLVPIPESVDLKESTTTGIGSYYLQYGDKLFTMISTYETEEGKFTLNGQVEALAGVVKLADKLSSFSKMDFSSGLNSTNSDDIKKVFSDIGAVMEDMSEEAIDTIKDLLADVTKTVDLPVDITKIELENVNWEKEGEIVADLLEFQDKDTFTEEDINTLIKDVADSTLILSCLDAVDVKVDITSEQKETVLNALDDVDEATKDKILSLFNITE